MDGSARYELYVDKWKCHVKMLVFNLICHFSVVEFVPIAVLAVPGLVPVLGGTLTTPFAILVISNAIRVYRAHCVGERTERPLREKWFSALVVNGNLIYIYIYI